MLHKSYKGSTLSLASALAVSSAIFMYTVLNKLGIGVSIHSFVTSKSVQGNYGLLWALASYAAVVLLPSLGYMVSFWLAVLLFFYSGTRSFVILKPAVVWLLLYLPPSISRRPLVVLYHNLYAVLCLCVAAANFDNSAFFFCSSPRKTAASLTCCYSLWHLDSASPLRQKLIWEGLWLSKPRYLYSQGLES